MVSLRSGEPGSKRATTSSGQISDPLPPVPSTSRASMITLEHKTSESTQSDPTFQPQSEVSVSVPSLSARDISHNVSDNCNFAIHIYVNFIGLNSLMSIVIDKEAYTSIVKHSHPDGVFVATTASGIDSRSAERFRLVVPNYYPTLDQNLFAFTVAALTLKKLSDVWNTAYREYHVVNATYAVAASGLVAKRKENDHWVPDGDWRFSGEKVDPELMKKTKDLITKNVNHLFLLVSVVLMTEVNLWNTNHHGSTGSNPLPSAFQMAQTAVQEETKFSITKEATHTYGHWTSTLKVLEKFGKPVRDSGTIARTKFFS
ncbi:unnamed protein product [Dicrocoelium dendriticum]|nr:unnamed protein product [Dicrocoelium dendriticum]